jgi:hypothetical protein
MHEFINYLICDVKLRAVRVTYDGCSDGDEVIILRIESAPAIKVYRYN